jgi:ATP-dependent RNA helicase RhlE
MLFTDFQLDDRLQRALATAGFVTPTPIQAAALPLAMAGRDLVGTAQTGTGKTAAFLLPILQQLISVPLEARKTRAVILAPTRELVEQILAMVRELGVHTNVRAVAVYGGVPMQQQTRALRNGVELVIACPGRLLDHIKRRNTDFRQVDCLVLDEADRMLDMGFLPSIQEIIDYVPAQRQTMLYSATFAKTLNAFVRETLRDPVRVAVDTAVPAQTVRHTLYQVKQSMKAPMLTALLRQLIPKSDAVLIFTQTRAGANEVAEHLYAAGMDVGVLHAEKTQRERQDTLDRFRAGRFPYLVATDIAARGIDVTSISHVINFDLPGKADDYLHRIGRTGRMERAGHAISLMTRGDVRAVRDIERMLGAKIEVARLEGGEDGQMSDAIPAERDGMAPRQPNHRRDERLERTRDADVAADRPHRRRNAEAPASRNEHPRKQFGSERPAGQQPRSNWTGRRRRDGEADTAPKRRAHTADNRFADEATPGTSHSGRKPFTGMAAAARYNRKYAAGKRQPGEVPSGPRPPSKSAPLVAHGSAPARAVGKKRAGRQSR